VNELALFAGAGGGILGGKLLGWNTIGAVEIEEYPRKVLLQRQRDGILEPFPIWDDITTFDGRPWKGCVDIISGGFPCQDISAAGKGAGIDGERSGLWGEMARIIDEIRPRFAFVENSPMLTIRGLGRVLGDLSEMGYNARWCVLGADDAGAPHRRKRIWILAYSELHGLPGSQDRGSIKTPIRQQQEGQNGTQYIKGAGSLSETKGDVADSKSRESGKQATRNRGKGIVRGSKITWWDSDPADLPDTDQFNDDLCRHGTGEIQRKQSGQAELSRGEICNSPKSGLQNRTIKKVGQPGQVEKSKRSAYNGEIRTAKPVMGRVAHGVAHRVDRLKAIGNGQVPGVAALAFIILSDGLLT